jgi:hypothetical protein
MRKRLAKSGTRYLGMSPRGEIAEPHGHLILEIGNCSGQSVRTGLAPPTSDNGSTFRTWQAKLVTSVLKGILLQNWAEFDC